MRRFAAAILVLVLVALNTRDAAAQPSAQDVAAYYAIAYTPVGAFAPLVLSKGWDAKGKYGFAARYGMHSPKVGDSDNSLGVAGSMAVGTNAIASATLGYTMVGCPTGATCDNGTLLGADLLSNLWSNSTGMMHVKFQGNLGWSKFGDGSALSAVVGAPLVWQMAAGGSSGYRAMQAGAAAAGGLSLFVTPAFGWGSLDDGTASESGTRPMVSLGGQYIMANGMGIHAGYNRIFIEDTGTIIGVGFTMNFGGAGM